MAEKTAVLKYTTGNGDGKDLIFVSTSPEGLRPVARESVAVEDMDEGKKVSFKRDGKSDDWFRLNAKKVKERAPSPRITIVYNRFPWGKPKEKDPDGKLHIAPQVSKTAKHVSFGGRFLALTGTGRLWLADSKGIEHTFVLTDGKVTGYKSEKWPKKKPDDTDELLAVVGKTPAGGKADKAKAKAASAADAEAAGDLVALDEEADDFSDLDALGSKISLEDTDVDKGKGEKKK